MKGKSKKITIVASIILLISLLIVAVFIRKGKNVDNTTIQLTAEQQRAANYKVLGEDEGKITEANSNVEFRVYFTRPKNDGSDKADKVDGTCKQLNSKDTLYMELNVLNDGKLKDGTITINGSNFNYSMFMIKDDVLKENYLSNDVTEIKLKDINAGTQKLIFGSVIADIANNTKNYSNKSTITLKGKYEPSSGEEVEIEKEYEITVDWYGDIDAKLNTYNSTYYYDKMNFNKIDFNFQVSETKNQLLLKEVTATAEIPQLNGKDPESVVCTDPSVEYTYNKESRIVTMTKKSTVGDDGIITKSLSRQNSFRVSVTYPQEAIDEVTSYTQLFVHVTGQYIGFNNTNQEFIDREKSKVVEATLPIIFRETPPPVVGEVRHYRHSFAVQLTDKKWVNKPSGRYVISKQDLLNLCDNPEYKGNYKYTVRWSAYSGDLEDINSYEMSETKKDEDNGYGDKIDDHILENYTTNKGIYFSNATNALGEDGKISVYNADTDELIKEFTKEDWEKCTEKEPLKYDEDVKHIKIVTSKPSEDSYLYVYHLKELDANKIVEDFTKEDIEGFTTIFTYLTGVASIQEKEASSTDTLDSATLVSETSDAKISIDPVKLHTQETTNAKIYIDTIKNQFGDADWKNGEFVVKLPENVTKLDVKKITTNKENVVKVDFYDVYKEGKNYLIKIITSNEEKTTYRITIDCDITPDSRISSGTGELDLYAYNEHSNQYYTNTDDVYDVNSNNNKKEKVGKANCSVEFISPTSLITLETVSEYDSEQEGEITIAPNVAEVERETGEAKISINLTNNYPNTVTGVKILGKIPYENNKSIINERDLKSEFNTTMVKEGIVADKEEVRKKMEVYYSEKEAPTQDLDDENNGWKLSSDGVNFENVKSYLILLHDYRIESKEGIELYYKVKLPKNVSYNKASYSTHAVYFDYVTDGGKIDLYTEPAKVGVKIVNKYNLELTKYKVGSDVVIPGVTYSLGYTEKDTEGVDQQKTRILTTNEQGKIEVKDLHAGVLYTLKEIKVPDTCELSKEVNTFILNEEGTVEYSGNYKNKDFENNKTLRIGLEDEVKVNLQVTKTKIGTDDLYINNARFTIEDEDGNKKTSATKDGKVTFTGLSLDKTYTLTESSVPGGIALKEGKYKFKLSRKNGSIEVQQIENSLITEKTEITEDDNHITSTLKCTR